MRLCPEATLTETPQGGFVLDRRTGSSFALNRLGVHVWKCLKDGRSADEIVTTLERRFTNVARSKLIGDVDAFLDGLSRRNLLER